MKTATLGGKRHDLTLDARLDGFRVGGNTRPEIAVNADLPPKAFLETLIHECLHACLPDLHEDRVHGTARDIGRVLWRAGYRRKRG